jgi:hypothetical protein
MNTDSSDKAPLHTRIHSSAGMKFLKNLHARSFSLNIFQMNALELMEATRKVRDPDLGLPLMFEANREAGKQAHRELNRHIHNFVASARSLVDHTRVFLHESYAGSPVLKIVQEKITTTFSENPVTAFVHDLRNYMLHKGLPNSHMFLHLQQDPSTGSEAQVTIGVRFNRQSLTEWSNWTAPAKSYMEQCGEHIHIHQFTNEYVVAVNRFHAWLEQTLREHHSSELQELEELQLQAAVQDAGQAHGELARTASAALPTSDREDSSEQAIQEPYSLSSSDSMAVDDMSAAWLAKVRKIVLPQADKPAFPHQRPVHSTLNIDDAIGAPLLITQDIDGEPVHVFLRRGNELFGLSSDDWSIGERMQNRLCEVPWIKERIGRAFIEDTWITWAQNRFSQSEGEFFSSVFLGKCRAAVSVVDVWVPVAHFEIESSLTFGGVKICPLTAQQIDEFEAAVDTILPDRREGAKQLFADIRMKYQGFAAVLFTVEAEPVVAQERALIMARDAIDLLRFFAPSALDADAVCPVALAGLELLPSSNVITVSEGRFGYSSSIERNVFFWRLSNSAISNLKQNGLPQAADLLDPIHPNEFAMAVRSSLITFSNGCTVADRVERLGYALSSLEGVLLRHEMEPVQASVAGRLAFLVSDDKADRVHIAQVVRHAYHLRKRRWTQAPSPREQQVVVDLVFYAHTALRTALLNAAAFETKAEFISALLERWEDLPASDDEPMKGD